MPAFIGMAVAGGASLLGGLFGSKASTQASKEQIAAEQKAENYLGGELNTGLGNYSPFLSAGQGATTTLSSLLGTPGQGLLTPWTQQFTAPTAAQAAATPGYQFQEQQGLSAAQNSAAGQGGLLSGRTLANLNNYAQGVASTNYQNTFNNALTGYQSAYNTFQNNQANQYSRLMGLSGQGLQAAQGEGGLISGVGGDIASLMGAQGASQAAGTVGSANAWSNALGGVSNSVMGGLTLNALNGNSAFGSNLPSADSASYNPNIAMQNGSLPTSYATPSAPYSPFSLPPGSSSSSSMPGFAEGTDFAPGGASMVGERGPEMVNLPRGSQVIPNGQVPNGQLWNLNGSTMPQGNPMPYQPPVDPRGAMPVGTPAPYRPVGPVAGGAMPVGTPAPYRPMMPQPSAPGASPVGTPAPYRPMPPGFFGQPNQPNYPLSALGGRAF